MIGTGHRQAQSALDNTAVPRPVHRYAPDRTGSPSTPAAIGRSLIAYAYAYAYEP